MKDEILAAIEFEESSKVKFNALDLIWDRSDIRAGRRIRVAYLVLAIQQLMGINLSVYYSTVIFSQVGLSTFLSSLLAAVMNTAFAAGTFFLPAGPFGIERVGRRGVLMYSAIILTFCLLIFTTMINLDNKTTATQWTGVAFIIIYNFVFGWGWIGVPWLYGPEVSQFSSIFFNPLSASLSHSPTNRSHRSHLSNTATSVVQPVPSANGLCPS